MPTGGLTVNFIVTMQIRGNHVKSRFHQVLLRCLVLILAGLQTIDPPNGKPAA